LEIEYEMNMKNMEEYHESGNKSLHTVMANKNETCNCLILWDTALGFQNIHIYYTTVYKR